MVTVNTKPSLEGYKFYYRRGTFRSIMLVFDILVMILMAVMALFTLFYYISYGKYFSTLVLYVVIIAIDAPAINSSMNAYKTNYNNMMKKHPDITQKYVFNTDEFIAEEQTTGHSSRIVFKYSSVKSARFGKGWFAVYLPGNKGFVFNEKDIVSGDPDELKILLRGGLDRKFKESR